MKNKSFYKEISADVEKGLLNIQKLKREFVEIKKDDIISRRAKGSILHDFYNCCERIFKKISQNINGEFEESDRWHRQLLARMTVDIKGIRPRVVSEKLASELDDYLSFRHIFRNIYGFELEGERLNRLAEEFRKISQKFEKEIKEFLRKLKK